MKAGGILLAGGAGKRMGQPVPKQFLEHNGRTVLEYCLEKFAPYLSVTVVVCHPDWMDRLDAIVHNNSRLAPVILTASGGPSRQLSVYNGLMELKGRVDIVAVHDSARPFFTVELLKKCISSAAEFGSGVAAVESSDTIVLRGSDGSTEYPDRRSVFRVQTPQAFRMDALLAAHEKALARNETGFTDDSRLFRMETGSVRLVPGSEQNMKITSPEDWEIAKQLLA